VVVVVVVVVVVAAAAAAAAIGKVRSFHWSDKNFERQTFFVYKFRRCPHSHYYPRHPPYSHVTCERMERCPLYVALSDVHGIAFCS
jgi:hypothetical protein